MNTHRTNGGKLKAVAAVTLAPAALLLAMTLLGYPNRLDNAAYDAGLSWIEPPLREDVVIVAVDARSLQQVGRWPWSRAVLAQVVEKLTDVGARAVGIDLILSERSATDPDGDERLAHAIAANGKVVLPVFPESTLRRFEVAEALPLPLLRPGAKLGHSDLELESEGVSRSIYLRAGKGTPTYPTLAIAMLKAQAPAENESLPGARNPALARAAPLSWVRDHRVMVPFVGPPGTVRQMALVDVLQNTAAGELAGKFVLIGVTAEGLRSAFITPRSENSSLMSGVEYHANVLNAALQGRLITPMAFPLHIVLALLCLLAPVWIYPRFRFSVAGWIFVALVAGLLALWLVALRAGYWFAPSPALMVLAAGFGIWMWRRLESTARDLRVEQERARATLMSVGDGVVTLDSAWGVRYMNPASQRLIGVRLHDVLGHPLKQVLRFEDPRDVRRLDDLLDRCALGRDTVRPSDPFIIGGNGMRRLALRVTASPIALDTGAEERFVIALSDVTDSLEMAQQMTHQATHDALTGLPNRILLTDRIRQSIMSAQRSGECVAVLFLDLDGFKRINDTLGHTPGDALLKAVADRLAACCRVTDTVARWGGDEFVVLMRGFSDKMSIAGPAHELQTDLRAPFQLGENEIHLSASIGIAVYPSDGEDAESLLKNADMAMYQAKRNGRNQQRFYTEQEDHWAHRHLETEAQLHRALRNGEFVVHYQPQMSLSTAEVVGFEALVRWNHPERGLLMPTQFLAIAEESDLIEAIGEHVMRIAFSQARRWEQDAVAFATLSINFSPRQFAREDLLKRIDRIIGESGISAHRIKAEVTETLIMSDSPHVMDTLRALRDRGVRLALDDFGVGYSSLNHLKRLPLDELKIDKTFTRDIARRGQDAAITEAFITLAHKMNLSVVAEGVENTAQLEILRRQRCDQVQGFYISPSVAAEAVPALCRDIAAHRFAGNVTEPGARTLQ